MEIIHDFLVKEILLEPQNSSLTCSTSLLEEGIIDSTGILELVGFIERTFLITFDDEELIPDNFASIAAIAAYIERKIAEQENTSVVLQIRRP